tara:strand:+ start:4598 stop:5542 length:945 start_codon:yes stop_codon:yes gene_type:complete
MEIELKTTELAKHFNLTPQRVNKIFAEEEFESSLKRSARYATPEGVRSFFLKKGYDYPQKTVSFFNSKGGVGKTSLLVMLAVASAQHGARVLVVDLDQQSNATITFDHEQEDSASMYEVVTGEVKIEDSIIGVADNIDLIPSSMNMTFLDRYIQLKQENLKTVIGKQLEKIKGNYDLVLIDLPPSLNTIVSSSILASNQVIIPTTAGRYALKGVNVAIQEIGEISSKFEVDQPEASILFNMFDARKNSCKEYLSALLDSHKEKLMGTFLGSSTLIENVRDGDFDFLLNGRKSSEKNDIFDMTKEVLKFSISEVH